jgi:uncharacterized membrane protein YuzA (DUF378 family)
MDSSSGQSSSKIFFFFIISTDKQTMSAANNKLAFQIAFVVVIIGALNWGLYAMDQNNKDLIQSLLPGDSNADNRKYVYYIVAIAGVVAAYLWLNSSGDVCAGQVNAQQKPQQQQ